MEDPIAIANLTKFLVDGALAPFKNSDTEESRSMIWDPSGGCIDVFSIFGMLAFLIAFLDLILDLQPVDGGRGLSEDRDYDSLSSATNRDEAISAMYSVLTSFINGVTSPDPDCLPHFLCEGLQEADATGPIGEAVHSIGMAKALQLFPHLQPTSWKEMSSNSPGNLKSKLAALCSSKNRSCSQPRGYMYSKIFDQEFIDDRLP